MKNIKHDSKSHQEGEATRKFSSWRFRTTFVLRTFNPQDEGRGFSTWRTTKRQFGHNAGVGNLCLYVDGRRFRDVTPLLACFTSRSRLPVSFSRGWTIREDSDRGLLRGYGGSLAESLARASQCNWGINIDEIVSAGEQVSREDHKNSETRCSRDQ